MKSLLLKNCYLVSPDVEQANVAVYVEGELIKKIYVDGEKLPTADEVIDCQDMLLMPGFVDVHCHGKSNFDFCDAKVDGITKIAVDKLSEGVTTLLPTTLTLAEEQLGAALESARAYVANGSIGCKIPGVHLEGPFVNSKAAGAQNPAYIRLPNIDEVKRLNEIFPVSKISYAPEIEGGADFSRDLLEIGVCPSAVHTVATYGEFKKAYNHGLRNLSHFCNQMTPLHHRDIGIVGAGLIEQDVYIELICDKLHVCPDMIQLIFTLKNIEYIQLISDAMRAAGMPDGKYDLGGLNVNVADGAARLDNGALAGSTLLICDALRNVLDITGFELKELVKTTSYNQARALKLDRIGKIEPLYYADMVLLNDDFQVQKTFVNGVCKYSRN